MKHAFTTDDFYNVSRVLRPLAWDCRNDNTAYSRSLQEQYSAFCELWDFIKSDPRSHFCHNTEEMFRMGVVA